MITENLSTLKIHKLTQEQYERALQSGNIDETALYLTPDKTNVLFVTLLGDDANSLTSSHSSSEIYENIQNGVDVYLNNNGLLYPVSFASPESVEFTYNHASITISEDGHVTSEQVRLTSTLIVTIGEDGKASHTSDDIFTHVDKGAMVLLDVGDDLYASLAGSDNTNSNFIYFEAKQNGIIVRHYDIDMDGNIVFCGIRPIDQIGMENYVYEQISDVQEQINNIGGQIGGGAAIIDVLELPTEDIREDCFYRLLTGKFVFDQNVYAHWIVKCVEEFPDIGESVLSGDLSNLGDISAYSVTAYYNITTGETSAYVPQEIAPAFGVPTGWYSVAILMGAVGLQFGGVITNILDDPRDGEFLILLERVNYSYKDGWVPHDKIGWSGTGPGAEVFNHATNTATGDCSHAEGRQTSAYGYYSHSEGSDTCANGVSSHAEGNGTTAGGNCSHAEGGDTTASGDYSHAEGSTTTASGHSSHVEGMNTFASGDTSHAEGFDTVAGGDYQHVQGKFNIKDDNSKYAHIVGNGTSPSDRSNAHTLDWNGNAWFQGNVYVGGTGQDDPTAKRLLTEDDIPEGSGGGDVWEDIVDITTTEEVTTVAITEDLNGNPFSLVEAEVTVYIMGTESNTADAALSIRTNYHSAAKGGTNSLATRMFRASGGPYKIGLHLMCHSENIRGTIQNIGNGQNTAGAYWNPNFNRFQALYLYGGTFGVGSRVVIRGVRE